MPSWHAPEHLAYLCKGEAGSIGGTSVRDGIGFEAWHEQEKMSRPALQPTQLSISWVPGVKQPWREADCSPLFVLRLRMIGGIRLIPQYTFIAWTCMPCVL